MLLRNGSCEAVVHTNMNRAIFIFPIYVNIELFRALIWIDGFLFEEKSDKALKNDYQIT